MKALGTNLYYLRNILYNGLLMSVEQFHRKEIIFMFGLEVAFFTLGFLACFVLMVIIFESNEKARKNRQELKKQKYEEIIEEQKEIKDSREDINIDIKVY